MDLNKKYSVKNRSAGQVVYNIPDDRIRREFAPGETKMITFGELEKLTYQPGGKTLLVNFLQIHDPEVTKEFNIKREPEYDMSEQDVVNLILNGSIDQFLDCLDFAGIGVIDLIKQFAVSLPMNDYEKRKALMDKTGFDVTKAIENLAAIKADEKAATEEKNNASGPPERRVKIESEPTGRRTSAPKYTILSSNSEEKKDS